MRVRAVGIAMVVSASFFLNVWGITWGLPQRWHPDELTQRAENMVGEPSLNPHYFAYGGFHYYTIAAFAVLPVKIPNKLLGFVDYDTQSTFVMLLSRLLSALMGSGIVYLTFRIGTSLFTRDVGLLAAAFTACAMILVNAAHFATADVPSLFWFMLACAAATRVFHGGSPRIYAIVGLCSGFAAAVKYVGGLALVPLLVAHVLRRHRKHGHLVVAGAGAVGAFVMGNPTLLFAPVELIDGFVAENLFNSQRGVGLPRAFLPLLAQLRAGVGLPLFLLSAAGFVYALWLLGSQRTRSQTLLLLAMVVPYYLLIGSMRGPRAGPLMLPIPPVRYTLPLVPFVLLLSAKCLVDLCRAARVPLRATAWLAIVLALGYSTAFAIAADLQFVNDSRYTAREWVLSHVPPGATVENTSYGPNIPSDRYQVLERPHDNHVGEVTVAVTQSGAFARYRSLTASLRDTLRNSGIRVEEDYVPWSAKAAQRYAYDIQRFDVSIEGLEARAPDVVLVSDLYTTRFTEQSSREGSFFADLRNGPSSYREVARLQYGLPVWLRPEPEFVNPVITVYSR